MVEERGVWGVGNVHRTTLTVQCHLRPLTFGGGWLVGWVVGVPGGELIPPFVYIHFHVFFLSAVVCLHVFCVVS